MNDQELSALLRLKRFEQPPPGYFDDLLNAVHRRQRTELLHRPLWRIAIERVQAFVSAHTASPMAYGSAFATLVVGGIVAIHTLTPGREDLVAQNENSAAPVAAQSAGASRFALQLQPGGEKQSLAAERPWDLQTDGAHTPRYVIDARPVSYDPLFSF